MRTIIVFLLILSLYGVCSASGAEYSAEKVDLQVNDTSPFAIGIGKLKDVELRTHASVPVTKISGSTPMYGFDFLIAYDKSALTSMGVFENYKLYNIPGDYEWEYFTYRFVTNCGDKCPSGLLEIVGIADQNYGPHQPMSDPETGLIKIIPDSTTLFTMDFLLTSDFVYECQFLPLEFFWHDCGDNIMALILEGDSPGNFTQAISRDIYSAFDSSKITDGLADFPTYNGAPDECMVSQSYNEPVRFIDFYNGGVAVKCLNCCGPERGDINLNGKAYEVADAVVFTNYLVYGPMAFEVNPADQAATTDINNNGSPLTLEDMVDLLRIIANEVEPPVYASVENYSGQLKIQEESHTITVSTSFEKDAGAINLCFYAPGRVDNIKLINNAFNANLDLDLKYNAMNDSLKILVYGFMRDPIPSNESILLEFKYAGTQPTLAYASAAGYYGERIKLDTYVIPKELVLHQNYPNPFNPDTKIEFGLPHASDVTLEIFDITGRKVTKLIKERLSSGPHSIIWNGRDKAGREVSSGIYFYRISAGDYTATKKMVLLK